MKDLLFTLIAQVFSSDPALVCDQELARAFRERVRVQCWHAIHGVADEYVVNIIPAVVDGDKAVREVAVAQAEARRLRVVMRVLARIHAPNDTEEQIEIAVNYALEAAQKELGWSDEPA